MLKEPEEGPRLRVEAESLDSSQDAQRNHILSETFQEPHSRKVSSWLAQEKDQKKHICKGKQVKSSYENIKKFLACLIGLGTKFI